MSYLDDVFGKQPELLRLAKPQKLKRPVNGSGYSQKAINKLQRAVPHQRSTPNKRPISFSIANSAAQQQQGYVEDQVAVELMEKSRLIRGIFEQQCDVSEYNSLIIVF